MLANLENSAVVTGLEQSIFIPIPKKGSTKEHSKYHITALITHASKVMLKIFQTRLQQYMNWELPNIQVGFKIGRGTKKSNYQYLFDHRKSKRIKKKQTTKKNWLHWLHCFLWVYCFFWPFVYRNNPWKTLNEMGVLDHLSCLLKNLYTGQEATVRTRLGTMDWFQIGKGVCQGCILSPCIFKLYAEYIMWNAVLDEAEAGIKIAGRNINNFR